MIGFTEIMPLDWPRTESIPDDVRARQLAERNSAGLLRWHVATFGPEAGPALMATGDRCACYGGARVVLDTENQPVLP